MACYKRGGSAHLKYAALKIGRGCGGRNERAVLRISHRRESRGQFDDVLGGLRHRNWSVKTTRSWWQWEPQWGAAVCVRAGGLACRVAHSSLWKELGNKPKIVVVLDGPRGNPRRRRHAEWNVDERRIVRACE